MIDSSKVANSEESFEYTRKATLECVEKGWKRFGQEATLWFLRCPSDPFTADGAKSPRAGKCQTDSNTLKYFEILWNINIHIQHIIFRRASHAESSLDIFESRSESIHQKLPPKSFFLVAVRSHKCHNNFNCTSNELQPNPNNRGLTSASGRIQQLDLTRPRVRVHRGANCLQQLTGTFDHVILRKCISILDADQALDHLPSHRKAIAKPTVHQDFFGI